MTIEEAVNLLTVKHLENKAKKWIRDPVAHTLYEVWKIADSKVTYHPSESATSNADRIRAMSDEELATLLVHNPWMREESALDWLQSPAEIMQNAEP